MDLWAGSRIVSGRVTDASGTGISSIEVRLGSLDDPLTRTTRTDARGHYRFDEASPSQTSVSLAGTGWIATPNREKLPESEEATTLDLVAWRGRPLIVQLKSRDRISLAGLRISTFYLQPGRTDGHRTKAYVDSDAGGRAVIHVPRVEGFQVAVTARDGYYGESVLVRRGAGVTEVPLRVRRNGTRATAWIAIDDPRVTNVVPKGLAVWLQRAGRSWENAKSPRRFVATAPDGRRVLELAGLEPGRYRVHLWQAGYRGLILEATASEAGVFPPPRTAPTPAADTQLTFRVVDRDGKRVNGAAVKILGNHPSEPLLGSAKRFYWYRPRDGQEFPSVAPGRYLVRVITTRRHRHASAWTRVTVPGPTPTLTVSPASDAALPETAATSR